MATTGSLSRSLGIGLHPGFGLVTYLLAIHAPFSLPDVGQLLPFGENRMGCALPGFRKQARDFPPAISGNHPIASSDIEGYR